MIPRPAQYLMRFDDLCRTLALDRWDRFEKLIAEFGIKPILAIVPDNRDPALEIEQPDPEFWSRMRAHQSAGAAIGLHGFRHLCVNHGRSLVPLSARAEFSGVPEAIQRQWIREGVEILRAHGLNPTVWVAPRHGFDRATLRALHEESIAIVSDGFARRPFTRGGLTWIPQQLWAPVPKSSGLWTICLHANTATGADVEKLRCFLHQHASQFTTVQRSVNEWKPTPLSISEGIQAKGAILRIRARNALRRFLTQI